MPFTRPRIRTAVATGAVTLGLVALGAGAASAHVTVAPGETAAGSYATLTFKVPNESADASTTKLRVDLPADTPFTSVSVEPVPGWTAKVTDAELPEPVEVHGTEVTEAPRTVVWTADDDAAAIAPGEFLRFTVSAGAVPEGVDEIVLPATQTYSDGEVVAWDDEAADGAEPEHPAPTVTVTPADEDGAHGGTASDAASDGASAAAASDEASTETSPLALGFGAAGLGLGLVGAVTGVVALRRSQRGGDR
ncbi:YcnI family protein [Isoptericola sp. BMS4]|uniref:YcnI family copper-binding membrane protein n=1 Tax=Isoptericola sp. BMS4 TaxID=2527875 RepID=UPI0014221936|nr:YcnI family protein [Isoptericola sp. BMS4]